MEQQQQAKTCQQLIIINLQILKCTIHASEQKVSFYEFHVTAAADRAEQQSQARKKEHILSQFR